MTQLSWLTGCKKTQFTLWQHSLQGDVHGHYSVEKNCVIYLFSRGAVLDEGVYVCVVCVCVCVHVWMHVCVHGCVLGGDVKTFSPV